MEQRIEELKKRVAELEKQVAERATTSAMIDRFSTRIAERFEEAIKKI